MHPKNILLLCIICLSFQAIHAQNEKYFITGTVLDNEGTPVERAIITLDGKKTNVTTDTDGQYRIPVREHHQIIGVVALATGVLEQKIEGRTVIDFFFNKESVELPEPEDEKEIDRGDILVNTGYSVIKYKHLSGAVGVLDVQHSKKKYSSFTEMLMATPGLVFIKGRFLVAGSINLRGYVPPLYILDGVPMRDFSGILPSLVSSICVLKDASSAIYGSQGYGGAVIITTRIP